MKDAEKTKDQLIKEINLLKEKISSMGNGKKEFEILAENTNIEEAIRLQGEDYRTFFNVSPVGIEYYDDKGMQVSANKASLEMFGVLDISELKDFNLFEGTTIDAEKIQKLQRKESIYYQTAFDFEKVKALNQYKTNKSGIAFFDYIVTPLLDEVNDTINGYLLIVQDITIRKLAEQELIRSEARFKSLYESLGDAVYVTKLGGENIGQILELNQAATNQSGYTREELLKMNIIKDLYVLGSADIGTIEWEQKLSKGERVIATEKKKRKDGAEYWTEVIVTPIEYKGETAALSINHDITERKKKDEALHESENRYRKLFTSANDAIFLIKNSQFISCNPKTLEMFACKEEDIIGKTPIDLSPEFQPDSEATSAKVEFKINATLKGEPQSFEWLHKRFDGSLFHAEISLNKIVISDSEYIQAIVRDVSGRKRAEKIQKVLHNISFAVNLSEDLDELIGVIRKELGTLIDTTNFFVAIYEEETDTILLPYIVDQKDIHTSFPAGKSYTAQVIKNKKSYLITEDNAEKFESNGKVEAVGTYSKIWLGVPMIIDGKVMGAIVVQSYEDKNAYTLKDLEILEFVSNTVGISIERKKAEQNLIQALEQATESDRLKSTFLASMSHELRTPLNAIIGFSDIIDEELPIDKILEFVKTINSSGNHLLSIVNDLFDITLIESGQSNIKKEEHTLQSILNEVNEIITVEQYKTNKSHIDLSLKVPVEVKDLKIITDASKLKQILINLLKNALKFTNEGSVKYGYSIESMNENSVIKFFVEDTGIGIPKNKQQYIFDVFRQAEESYTKTHGGTGIGLTISKKLVELLGGKIWLESEVEDLQTSKVGGTVFYFTLPFQEIEPESDQSISLKIIAQETPKPKDSKTKTILIVEDDESSYEFLRVILAKFEANTIWAKNGKIAVEYCKEMAEIDLVLMDINMPVMNGYEATKLIKEMNSDLPIIAQTAFAIIGDRQKSIEAGCDDYISKPIKREELLKTIKQYLA